MKENEISGDHCHNMFVTGKNNNNMLCVRTPLAMKRSSGFYDFHGMDTQCVFPSGNSKESTMNRRPSRKNIVKIVSGLTFSFFLTEEGDVFGCGDDKTIPDVEKGLTNKGYSVKKVTFFDGMNVVDISCGDNFTFFVTCENVVYVCGMETQDRSMKPDQLNGYETIQSYHFNEGAIIKEISCGSHHALFVTRDGKEIYGCGLNDFGQLGTLSLFVGKGSYQEMNRAFDSWKDIDPSTRAYKDDQVQIPDQKSIDDDVKKFQPLTEPTLILHLTTILSKTLDSVTRIVCGDDFSAILTSTYLCLSIFSIV